MNRPARKLDIVAMSSATHVAAQQAAKLVEMAIRLQDDSDRSARVAECLCSFCYCARGQLGGVAMTTQPCSSCNIEMSFGSTTTDVLCPACAKAHSLCKRCGGDREMRTLRRKWPSFTPVLG